jgi:hypothetical protein
MPSVMRTLAKPTDCLHLLVRSNCVSSQEHRYCSFDGLPDFTACSCRLQSEQAASVRSRLVGSCFSA